jgi:hypothetical protein
MACAFMMRSMLADQPNLLVTRMHGVSVRRLRTKHDVSQIAHIKD